MPVAAVAAMPHHAAAVDGDADAGCSPQAEHHEQGDRQDDGKDHFKLTHKGCCVMACGMSALAPAQQPIPPIEWASAVLPFGDDALRDRTVSPLRRPPRPAA
ncbi:hypothetical protein [Azospirillum isscasi]|uniref:Uncharacterized protein n=1 Tax=Azospirillum isscasi TaxID=3053926 RepID=A0ABU0WD94_9PROT|nr:hypothetical protein [Azospirillum isscasi]MDQ2102151.1 hypothetical protein [Azospirillum isscasi]